MAAMVEGPPPRQGPPPADVLNAPPFACLVGFLWRAGAFRKTKDGLMSEQSYLEWNTLLHYALLPNLQDRQEAEESAAEDWCGAAWAFSSARAEGRPHPTR